MEKEIIEGDKLIAVFANEDQKIDQRSFWITVPGKEMKHWVNDRDLKYHSSWDWLMPIVEKIERDYEMTFHISGKLVSVLSNDGIGYEWNGSNIEYSKILSVWYSVVDFIKWYNKIKQL